MVVWTSQSIIDTHSYKRIPAYKPNLRGAIRNLELGNHPNKLTPYTIHGRGVRRREVFAHRRHRRTALMIVNSTMSRFAGAKISHRRVSLLKRTLPKDMLHLVQIPRKLKKDSCYMKKPVKVTSSFYGKGIT
jgi:hypothetical protein